MLLVSHKMVFLENEVAQLRNYVETCKGICGYDLVYNFFCIPLSIKKFSFCGALFKRILTWEEGTSKTWF